MNSKASSVLSWSQVMSSALPIAWIDCETTGINPRVHCVTEIWCELTDAAGEPLGKGAGGRVILSPEEVSRAQPKALEVGHYDSGLWARTARPWEAVWLEIGQLLSPLIIKEGERARPGFHWGGHYPLFDQQFVHGQQLRRSARGLWTWGTVDTLKLARDLLTLPKYRLTDLCLYYGIAPQPGQAHTARGDVGLEIQVYRRLRGGGSNGST